MMQAQASEQLQKLQEFGEAIEMSSTEKNENYDGDDFVQVSKRDYTTEGHSGFDIDDDYHAERLTSSLDGVENSEQSEENQTVSRQSPGFGIRNRITRERITVIDDEEGFIHKELILKIRKTMPLKDFTVDFRANRDLEKFLISPVVILDITHTSLDKIIGEILDKLKKDLELDEKISSRAEKTFFTLNEGFSFGTSVDNLRETIEGVRYKVDGAEPEHNWVTTVCSLPLLKKSHVGVARLRHPLNLGSKNEEVLFVVAVIAPKKEKFTKNAVEIGRTFSSLMINSNFRHKLVVAPTEEVFKNEFSDLHKKFQEEFSKLQNNESAEIKATDQDGPNFTLRHFGCGVKDDLKRRLPHYWSDFVDGLRGKTTIMKVTSTIFFLYFACLLPAIAFGTVYEEVTYGDISVKSCIVSQAFAGLVFAFFGGQPLLVVVTTAPLALFVKAIKLICTQFNFDFRAIYAMTGFWSSLFLIIQSLFNVSTYVKYSTRSTEEIFEFFVAIAFALDAIKATVANFGKNYHFSNGNMSSITSMQYTLTNFTNNTLPDGCLSEKFCFRPENSILFLLLMLATVWVGLILLRFDESHFLSATKREFLKDYALPIATITLSLVGSFLFGKIKLEPFKNKEGPPELNMPDFANLSGFFHATSILLGFSLSCLFFVDQSIAAAALNAPKNKLKKGPSYHWDLLVVGLINIPLSLFALPWVHGAIPHSPFHLKALADVEQHVTNVGTAYDEVVEVRETRLTVIVSHILIALSLLIVPFLQNIPVPVLEGVFLYFCFSSFLGNQMFERMALFVTEGSSYPPNHYVRKVPQRKLHLFTLCQIAQLGIISFLGFFNLIYTKMLFPIVFILLWPVRHVLIPKFIERCYLDVLDS